MNVGMFFIASNSILFTPLPNLVICPVKITIQPDINYLASYLGRQ